MKTFEDILKEKGGDHKDYGSWVETYYNTNSVKNIMQVVHEQTVDICKKEFEDNIELTWHPRAKQYIKTIPINLVNKVKDLFK